MPKYAPLVVALLVAAPLSAQAPEQNLFPPLPVAQMSDVYLGGADGPLGTPNVRIPGFVVTPHGTLLVFVEGRIGGSDPGAANPIALLLKRSTDGGVTWSAPIVIERDPAFDFANPTPLVDKVTGTVWLAYDQFPDRCGSNEDCIIPGNDTTANAKNQVVWVRASHDDGVTWSARQLIAKPLQSSDGTFWRSATVGPGSGIQLDRQRDGARNGRLVIPARRNGATALDAPGRTMEPITIYSDDHGTTWQWGAAAANAPANEAEVVELADGRVMMEGRQESGTHRWRWWSQDGGVTWGEPAAGDFAITAVDASVIRLRDGRIAFVGPAGPGRRNISLWLSRDGGKSFPVARTIASGTASYSVVQEFPNGDLGVIYEATGSTLIRFIRIAGGALPK